MGLPTKDNTDRPLNRLLNAVPEGVAVPSTWLTENGISPQLVRKYVSGGWLMPLARGVFARPALPVGWQGVVVGLQRLGGSPVHVGGVSALNLQGKAHYLPLGGAAAIHLWSHAPAPVRLPAWVVSIQLPQQLVLHGERLFEPAAVGEGLAGVSTGLRDWQLKVAAPERAIMEVLSLVDETPASFTHAAELFEGLTVLRPEVVQRLLEGCRSIKVRRLFLYLASLHGYPWYKKLQLDRIALGSGKRLVTRGGRLNKRFLITVPENMDAGTE
jgi:hypothetical protein